MNKVRTPAKVNVVHKFTQMSTATHQMHNLETKTMTQMCPWSIHVWDDAPAMASHFVDAVRLGQKIQAQQ